MSCSSATRHAGESVRRVRDAHVLHPVAQGASSALDEQVLVAPGLVLLGRFFSASSVELAQVERALGDRLQRLALELGAGATTTHSSTRSASSSTSMPFLRKISRCGLFFAAAKRVGGDVVDRVLAFLHAADVVGERDGLLARCRSCVEAKRSSFAMRSRLATSSPTPSLSTRPNSFQNVAYFSLLVLARGLRAARARACAQPARIASTSLRLLQDLARDVERQVVRVDHAADEAQVRRQQLLGVVHDEDAPDVELDAVALLAVPQVERRARRDVEQLRVFLPAFDLGVRPGERRARSRGRRACRTRGTARR